MKKIIVPICAAIFLGGVVFFFVQNKKHKENSMMSEKEGDVKPIQKNIIPNDQPDKTPPSAPGLGFEKADSNNGQTVSGTQESDVKIRITVPNENEIIRSPLEIRGEASGWYFEGSFPVRIEDESGKVLGRSSAHAQGEWMTENHVPFEAKLRFEPGEAERGKIIFEKDNPSGNAGLNESFELPVRFKASNESLTD